MISEAGSAVAAALLRDAFEQDRRRGKAIGSSAADGTVRHGRDVEGVIGIDHGALRIGTLAQAGWGRAGVCYGPFEARAGRACSFLVLNGHNTSEDYELASVLRRVARWAAGSGTDPMTVRLRRYPGHLRREPLRRKVRYWRANRLGSGIDGDLDNLAVGWFAGDAGSDPAAMVVRATGPHNGALATAAGEARLVHFAGLQNLPVHYVSLLRSTGVIHYAASSYAGAGGLPAAPGYRPLGINTRPLPGQVHAGVFQRATGQIGFSADSRVLGAAVVDLPELSGWFTTATVADGFTTPGPLDGRAAERGGCWQVAGAAADAVVDERGAGLRCGAPGEAFASLPEPAAPRSGLLHAEVELGAAGRAVLVLRRVADDDEVRLVLSPERVVLELHTPRGVVAIPAAHGLCPEPHQVQLSDDGCDLLVSVDGVEAVRAAAPEPAGAGPAAVGIRLRGSARVRRFEVHPRAVALPAEVQFAPERLPLGATLVCDSRFGGLAGDLDGAELSLPGKASRGNGASVSNGAGVPLGVGAASGPVRLRRRMGDGRLVIVRPEVAAFQASRTEPVPNRTAYLADWDDPGFCDVEIEVMPPNRDGPDHRCRAGVMLYQDERNYMAVNIYLDDAYPAASASTFFTFNGFEDIYDAVWSNLGERVVWERPFQLRLVSDGRRFAVLVDGEPVLHRAFTDVYPRVPPLRITAAGIVAQWEWGHDTGSEITRLTLRGR